MHAMSEIGVYILLCNNGRYYIGSTNDLQRRITEHTTGHVQSTKNILPISLKFFYACPTIREARIIEYRLKKKKSKKIINQIIQDRKINGLWAASSVG